MMFPLTHIWFSDKVLGYTNSYTVLGAIFPDIVITKCLNYKDTHYIDSERFYKLCASDNRSLDFVRALYTHAVSPKGLDYYGDERYFGLENGYCFQIGSQIESDVIKYCNIPKEYGLWKAHNFIEMGIELNVLNNNKELNKLLHNTFKDSEAINYVSNILSMYYRIEENTFKDSFSKYSDFIEINNINSLSLAKKYHIQMITKHNISIDIDKCAEIIEKSRILVRDSFEDFISSCLINVSYLVERLGDYSE